MEMEITLPENVPVMTLPDVVFFPQALLPLHIFEDRYRQMLRDVLSTNRLFAVAGLNARKPGDFEPLHRIATVGIVRACQKNENGTSNLLLQGLVRVECRAIVREEPYRRIAVRALTSTPAPDETESLKLRATLARLIGVKQRLGGAIPPEFAQFLRTVDDPEVFLDLAASNLCEDPGLKQTLLETLDVPKRYELFSRRLRAEIETMKLNRKLQGPLSDDEIGNN